jgi:ATP-dependent exoDNAse (exonuclease V) beta subunit
MTMHKAKGLEFEVVVLLGLGRRSASDRAPMLRVEQVAQRVLFGPIKAKIDKEVDPLAAYLGRREALRQSYELDRLLYVASTRARQSLHLVVVCSVDPKTGQWSDPESSSLLARLWPHRPRLPEPPEPLAQARSQSEAPWRFAPIMRRRLEPIETVPVRASTQSSFDRFVWPVHESAERLSGILIHAWLARLARQRRAPDELELPTLEALRQQLRALGLPAALRAEAASEVLAALSAMLGSQRGRWLLTQPLRQVEWALMDASQTISIMDLAIEGPDGWLVVDYKTSRPKNGESAADFSQRMIGRYRAQMTRYREQLQRYDARAVRTVLYFPRDDHWIEVH